MTQKNETAVLYNADCPVCSYEINHYAAYSRNQALPIRFDDLNDSDLMRDWDMDADRAAQRLHVLKDGALLSGIPAFIALWQEMPRYRWLARVVRWPILNQIACVTYDRVLAPLIYRWHLRRIRRRAS